MYSKVKQCAVVVSEIAKSHSHNGESSGVRKHAALTAAVLIALGSLSFTTAFVPMTAEAATKTGGSNFVGVERTDGLLDDKEYDNYGGKGANGADSITLGLRAKAGERTITIGDRNAGASLGSVYVGQGDIANPKLDNGGWATSIGYNSDATGYGSIALGSNAVAKNSYAKDSKGNSLELNKPYDDNGVTKFRFNSKPDIQRASVAIGYGASADNGNIAIGSYSEASTDLRAATDDAAKAYLTEKTADSYVSVGKTGALRRISNVADGASASDVATVGQLQALSKEVGSYKKGFGIKIDADSTDNTKNTISLDRNLGNDYNTTDDVNLKNDADGTSLILGGRVEKGSPTGGQSVTGDYGALGRDSVTVGGVDNTVETTGNAAVVVGGIYNKAAGTTSAVVGGSANDAIGNESAVFGGQDNDAYETYATISGGSWNKAYGKAASIFGGSVNDVSGKSSVAVGGYGSHVYGDVSVGIAGGSTNADYALAAGNEATVTVNNGTAIGYQATANKEGTVAFGHDKGDVYYTSTWPQKATEKDGKYYDAQNKEITKDQYEALRNADLTFNDYSQKPKVTENKYDAAAYNRLVKVADGVDDHDVVVMEQLNNAKNDLKVNAGWGINVNDVTTKNDGKETTTKNVISLNRNLGTNYGNPWKGEGKVTFEAGGENSMILGGAASILFNNEEDNVKAGAYGKDSVLVGGFNNLIDTVANDVTQTGEDAVIVGGDTNTVTGLRSVIVGGSQNKVSGGHSIVIGGASNETDGGGAGVFGGQLNKAAGGYSSVLGGDHNEADGDWSSAIGGTTNTASGLYATTLGGKNNVAKGKESVVVGGGQNVAIGEDSTVNGGAENTSYGMSSYAAGGMKNMAFGNASVALGGINSNVNAKVSTGIAGGSTEEKAITALAAGHQSVVTNSGVEWRKATQEDFDAINQKLPSWSGFIYTEPEDPYTTYVLDKVSTAVGYQSTADAPGVIAFGHDKGDVASVAKKWKQKATMEVDDNYSAKYYDANHKEISADDYYKLANADGTWNDYTQDPIGTENTTYQSAYYNRLVKAADGIDAHDAVVMEQLKPYTKSDASNVGANLKTYTVGEDGETITEANATADQKKANENAWGEALGTGTVTKDSKQLVTGSTVYNEVRPSKDGKYVKIAQTTGANLIALDDQVKTNTDKLSDVDSRSVKYDTKKVNDKTVVDNTKITLAGEGGTTITNLKAGVNDNDAATVGQLNSKIAGVTYTAGNGIAMDSTAKTISAKAGNGITVDTNGINAKAGTGITVNANGINVNTGKHLSVNTNGQVDVDDNGKVAANDGNLVTGKTVYDALNGGLDKIIVGTPGENGKDGAPGTIGLVGPAGANGKNAEVDITIQQGKDDASKGVKGANGVDGTDGITRIVYKDAAGDHQVATMEDGLKFAGDDGQNDATKAIAKKLNNTVDIIGGADSTKLTANNIGVNNVDGKLKVQLAQNLTGITSISNQPTSATTTTGAKIELGTNGTTISGGDVNVSKNKITGLKDGTDVTDAATVGQVDAKIKAANKYYSVNNGVELPGFNTNEDNLGASAKASMAAGYTTVTAGIASTVVGSYSGVIGSGLQGAAAVSVGTVNVNSNTDTSKAFSGVANSIVGQANMTTDSNAAIIVGAGNSVTNSYRDLDTTTDTLSNIKRAVASKDANALKKALQDAVPKSGAQVMVMGGGNSVDKAYMTQVVGVGNTVTGSTSEYNENTSNTSTQLNYVDGFYNTIEIGKNNYVIGSHNTLTGSSVDTNKSNLVLGDNHKLTNQKNNVILGSADNEQETKASEAVVIGHNADVSVNGGVAIGSGSVSKATAEADAEGYDPVSTTTNKASTNTSATWKATTGAVSIGGVNGNTTTTRRITNLAAGFNDTDAVNVAQIKKLASVDASNIGKNFKNGDVTANENAWGEALGTGTVTKDSKQLVTGGTVYNEVRPSKDGKYVKIAQTTGANLIALDDQVKTNTDKLSDVDSRSVKYDTKKVNDKTVVDNTKITLAGEGGTTITNLKAGVNDNDAATVGQLNSKIAGVTYTAGNGIAMDSTAKTISAKAGNGITVDTNGINAKAGTGITVNANGINVNTGKHLSVNTNGQVDVDDNGKVAANDGNLVTGKTVYDALNGGLDKIIVGTPGENGKDGAPGTIGLVGPAGANGKNAEVDITIQQGKDDASKGVKGANGVDGTDGITRIVYKDAAGDHQVATMEDGLKFAGDDGQNDATKAIAKKLNNTVDIIGGADSTKLTANNIGVNNVDGKLKIQLAQELTGITSISGSTGSNGAKITLDTNDQNISVNGGKITNVASGLSTNDGSYNAKDANNAANISDVNSMISKAVTDAKGETQKDLDKKANVDASNIGTNLKGTDGKTAATEAEQKANLDKWGNAIGTGEVKDGSNQLVTGNTVYNAVKDKADKSYVDTQLNTKANTDGSNIDADKFSKKVAIGKIDDSDERAVSGKTVHEAIQTINGNIDGKANKNLDNIDDAGKNVIKDQARAAVTIDNKGLNTNVVATQDDKNHTTTYTINVEGNGKVAAKDTGLISGDTIYNELRPATDGTYIKTTNTTAQNLTSLDTQVRATHDLINSDGKTIKIGGSDAATKIDVNGKDGKGRVITGVVSDANDPNSAANVGYVNGLTAANTQQIYRDMNNAYGRLNNNINKAAAGSNALAALHPLDYDPDDKADFAVGYGHYRNANAAAVGAFYHPNENTMVNVGVSLGNGDPGFNAGVSFKVGRGGAGREAMSKTEMAKVINSQSKEIDALKKDNADKDKRIDALEQKMAEILAKLDKNGK